MVVIDNIQQTPGVLENDQKLLTPILSSLEISVKVYLFFLGYSFASVNLNVQISGVVLINHRLAPSLLYKE